MTPRTSHPVEVHVEAKPELDHRTDPPILAGMTRREARRLKPAE